MTPAIPRSGRLSIRKLHPRAMPVVFAFFMASIMAFLMCCVIVVAGSGLDAGTAGRILHAYKVAMPAAFVCVLLVRPLALRLAMLLVRLPV